MLSNENLLSIGITDDELCEIIASLKNNKAAGWDCITAEHIKYGGVRLTKCIQCLFQLIVNYEYVPNHFKLGIIVPIPKGTKCQSNQDNYRGITLLPVIAKMYEKWIMIRVKEWAINNNVIHRLQGADQDKCSSLHTAWLVRETIAYNVNKVNLFRISYLINVTTYDTV